MTEFRLAEGDSAPNFSVQNQDGNSIDLKSFRGQKVIVYFYPAAATPGCTKEACDFNSNIGALRRAGYEVLAISPDSVSKLKKFKDRQNLDFELLSDEGLAVHKAWGAFGMKSLYGRVYEGVLRSTFVIDENGKTALALYNVKATGHVEMLRKKLSI
jgi:peroxiredoxin Q/BCP